MWAYTLRRLLLALPTVFLVSFIVFFIIRLIPGDVLEEMARQVAYGSAEEYQRFRQAVARELGLDVPILTQYGRWLGVLPRPDGRPGGLLQGNLGDSLWTKAPVLEEILHRWPVTVDPSFLALLIAQLAALPIGIYSALRQDAMGDYITRSLAIMLITVFGTNMFGDAVRDLLDPRLRGGVGRYERKVKKNSFNKCRNRRDCRNRCDREIVAITGSMR